MPRKRRKRPNWPYRFAWLGLWLALLGYVGLQTVLLAATYGQRAYGTDWGLSFVASLFDATVAVFFFVVGACIGSFLNVVVYRLPLGRFIGGHSACPYCQTPIDGADNVPFLAWIKLRGRCRTCHLPISIEYPLVELAVALLFAFVYATEFARGGANLPGVNAAPGFGGVVRITIDSTLIMRIVAYLFLLSGLVAAALIALKGKRVPLHLYVWSGVPLVLAGLALPETIVVPWRETTQLGPVELRLDSVVTLACGAAVGIAIARLLAPLAYRGFDRSLIASDPASTQARQFIGGMALAGCCVGWQSCVPLAWCIVLGGLGCTSLLQGLFGRQISRTQPTSPDSPARNNTVNADNTDDDSNQTDLSPPDVQERPVRQPSQLVAVRLTDLTVWIWLGLLLFRANWDWLLSLQMLPDQVPEIIRHVVGALLLAPVVWYFAKRTAR